MRTFRLLFLLCVMSLQSFAEANSLRRVDSVRNLGTCERRVSVLLMDCPDLIHCYFFIHSFILLGEEEDHPKKPPPNTGGSKGGSGGSEGKSSGGSSSSATSGGGSSGGSSGESAYGTDSTSGESDGSSSSSSSSSSSGTSSVEVSSGITSQNDITHATGGGSTTGIVSLLLGLVGAAALVSAVITATTFRRRQHTKPDHPLKGSISRRMNLFHDIIMAKHNQSASRPPRKVEDVYIPAPGGTAAA